MPLELETWRLVAQWMASLGIALALTALALRSLRGVGLAAGSAGLAGVSTLLALGARAGELDAFPIGSTADFCLGLAAVWLTLAAAAGWRLRPGAPRAAAAVLGVCCLLAVLGLGYFAAHKPGYDAYGPTLRSVWLPLHTLAWTLGLGLVVFAAASGLLARSPAARQMALAGFVLVTLGIVTGAQWSLEAWGAPWVWEPKSILAALTWLVLAVGLWSEPQRGTRSLRLDASLLTAALLMLVSLTSLAWLPGAGSSLHTRSQLDQERALSRVTEAVHDSHAAQLQAFLAQE